MRRRSNAEILLVVLCMMAGFAQPAGADKPGEFACLIRPKMVLKLGSPVPGLISEVLVDRGAIVKKGEIVARLVSNVEEANLALAEARAANDSAIRSAQAKLDYQKRKAERMSELRKDNNVSISAAEEAETAASVAASELHEAEVNQQLARLDLVRSREMLNQRTIHSPIDGVVTERTLGPGEYAFDQAHILTVAQIDPLDVDVFVPLSEFGKIRPGMLAEIYPENPVGGQHDATVDVVDRVFDAASGTIGVRLELPNPNYTLPAGLKCEVRFAGMG
jgi:RND family efflux transporter MFP subunit